MLSTETHYALVYTDDQSLLMSRVYTIRNMKTQAADMAELVLFYAHATLSTQTLPPPPGSVTSAYRVMVPFFPSSIFKPHEGIVRIGKVVRFLNLSTLRRPSGQSFPQFLPLRIYGYSERIGHDGEIVVTFIRLIFLLFQAKAVAKTAYGNFAPRRLNHEVDVYDVLRLLQGIAIPRLFGLFRNHSDGSSVLIVSHEGVQLQSFDSLSPADRFVFLLSSCELVSSLNTGRPSLPASPVSTRRAFNTTI